MTPPNQLTKRQGKYRATCVFEGWKIEEICKYGDKIKEIETPSAFRLSDDYYAASCSVKDCSLRHFNNGSESYCVEKFERAAFSQTQTSHSGEPSLGYEQLKWSTELFPNWLGRQDFALLLRLRQIWIFLQLCLSKTCAGSFLSFYHHTRASCWCSVSSSLLISP